MIDREKVIKGLEFTKAMITFNPLTGEDIEPENLNEENKTTYDACVGALALLKEQEAQSVLSNRVCENEPFRYVRKGFCPKCHQEMEWLFNRKHCGFCGQAVKWE